MSINFGKISSSPDSIPSNWIYHYYLNLKEPLDGRKIKISSPFSDERSPSMFLYVKNGEYRWKDFSSSKSGTNGYYLVREIFNAAAGSELSWKEIFELLRSDYKKWVGLHGEYSKEKLSTEHFVYDLDCEFRISGWEAWDVDYWGLYNINRELLEHYNVYPLSYFQLYKTYAGGKAVYKKQSLRYCYGFFNDAGQLLKIYNPKEIDMRHINVRSDILGRGQLTVRYPTCIIASSMKDMLTIKSLKLDIDVIALMSEKSTISTRDLDYLNTLYSHIFTLFDNDKTGIRSMVRYLQTFGIDYIYFEHQKDISDCMATCRDPIWIKSELVRKINRKINEKEHPISRQRIAALPGVNQASPV